MARKVIEVTISEEGRDRGKVFVLTEMPAAQAEKWAARAFLALARSEVDIPDEIMEAGLAGVAVLGFKMLGRMQFADAEQLLDEMFTCVAYRPDPKNPTYVRAPMGDDIEEVRTRVRLRTEVFTLHTGFFLPGNGSTSASASPSP
jgi:hypothetical protein